MISSFRRDREPKNLKREGLEIGRAEKKIPEAENSPQKKVKSAFAMRTGENTEDENSKHEERSRPKESLREEAFNTTHGKGLIGKRRQKCPVPGTAAWDVTVFEL